MFVRRAQVLLALLPRLGERGAMQDGDEVAGALQSGEHRAEPLGVRRVLLLHQKAQSHRVAHEPRADERRSDFIADSAGATHEMLFLPDARPARRQQIEPYVVRVIAKAVANSLQPDAIVIDRAGCDSAKLLLRKRSE